MFVSFVVRLLHFEGEVVKLAHDEVDKGREDVMLVSVAILLEIIQAMSLHLMIKS